MHFVYRVTGDEEATSAGSTDAFYNDGFFVESLTAAVVQTNPEIAARIGEFLQRKGQGARQ